MRTGVRLCVAFVLAGCGAKPTAEKQDSVAARNEATTPATRAPVVALDAGRVLLDGGELVKIVDLPPEVEMIGPLFDALSKPTASRASDSILILRADKDAPALLINAVLRTAKAAGYTTISLCPPTGDPNETCPRLVLSDRSD